MLKVAVLGAGTMGTEHSRCYVNMAGADLVGIVDIRPNVGGALAEKRGTRYFASIDDLLASGQEVDVVDICLPTYLHREYVEKVAALGKHVICEKPIARTLEDARALIDACDKAGVRLFVAHVVRFFHEYVQIRKLLDEGKLGRVGTVRAFRGGGFPTAWNDWYAQVEKSGTLVVDSAIHDFDYLLWCFGEVKSVYAKGMLGRDMNRIDHCLVSLEFRNGIIGHVEGTWAFPGGFRTELEIAGTEGLITHNSDNSVPMKTSLKATADRPAGVQVPASPVEKSPYQLELEHFFECIETGKPSIVTAEDGYKALEISLAALKSIQTGEVVTL